MEITIELVNHLANLSRLNFDEQETENFKNEFAKTLEQVDKIEKADLSNVEILDTLLNAQTDLRDDECKDCLSIKDVIKNAPDNLGNSILIPVEIV